MCIHTRTYSPLDPVGQVCMYMYILSQIGKQTTTTYLINTCRLVVCCLWCVRSAKSGFALSTQSLAVKYFMPFPLNVDT